MSSDKSQTSNGSPPVEVNLAPAADAVFPSPLESLNLSSEDGSPLHDPQPPRGSPSHESVSSLGSGDSGRGKLSLAELTAQLQDLSPAELAAVFAEVRSTRRGRRATPRGARAASELGPRAKSIFLSFFLFRLLQAPRGPISKILSWGCGCLLRSVNVAF